MSTKSQVFAAAQKELNITTLETRRSDELDFHNIAVWEVRAAFEVIWKGREPEIRRLRERIAVLEQRRRKCQPMKS